MLLERLKKVTGLTDGQLERFALTASNRYRVYPIEKRTGGVRLIAQPSREIKAIQRWLNRTVFRHLPVHAAATAYSKGASIRENAGRHVNTRFTVRLDFADFFPSFKGEHVHAFLGAAELPGGLTLSAQDLSFVRRIVCRRDQLTIGAPSSPLLTNTMMFEFDQRVAQWCEPRRLIYTRYADDLFISSTEPNALMDVPREIAASAAAFRFARLVLNLEKTAFLSKKYRRAVTGLIITPDGRVSIGLDRKRNLKADVYRFAKGTLDPSELSRVRGMISFVKDVESSFYETLVRKYGRATMDDIARD